MSRAKVIYKFVIYNPETDTLTVPVWFCNNFFAQTETEGVYRVILNPSAWVQIGFL